VVGGKIGILESLAAIVADKGSGVLAIHLGDLGRIRVLVVLFGGCLLARGRLKLLEGLLLVLLEPCKGSLYCVMDCVRVDSSEFTVKGNDMWIVGNTGQVRYLRPPVFFTASSARAFSKPISSRRSKSDCAMAVLAVVLWCGSGSCLEAEMLVMYVCRCGGQRGKRSQRVVPNAEYLVKLPIVEVIEEGLMYVLGSKGGK
jgi:hypothetical protein